MSGDEQSLPDSLFLIILIRVSAPFALASVLTSLNKERPEAAELEMTLINAQKEFYHRIQ